MSSLTSLSNSSSVKSCSNEAVWWKLNLGDSTFINTKFDCNNQWQKDFRIKEMEATALCSHQPFLFNTTKLSTGQEFQVDHPN